MHKSYTYNLETFKKRKVTCMPVKKRKVTCITCLYSLRPKKHAILTQCHGLISQVWLIIDKKIINIYDIK